MSGRRLLLEHNCPVYAKPADWKVEWVTPEPFGASLVECNVAAIEAKCKTLSEALLNSGQLTEEHARTTLASIKDQLSRELKEAHQAKRLRVSGPAQVENVKNGNGRVYPTALWDRVLGESSEFMSRLRDRQTLGELEHPSEGNTKLPRVSHLVEHVWRKQGVIYAQHLIFRTPGGGIIEELYNAGAAPGVSSRGAGSTKEVDGADMVEAEDFHLDTWDFVAQPSVSSARPTRMGESNDDRRNPPASQRVIFLPTIVDTCESQRSQPEMTKSNSRAVVESLTNARTLLSESDKALSAPKRTVAGLCETQSKLTDFVLALPESVDEELRAEFGQVKAQLGERINSVRREINRLAEEDDEQSDAGEENDAARNDDGEGSNDGEDPKQEALRKLKGVTATQVIEGLTARVAELESQTKGQVSAKRYRTAIELGEATVARAKSDRKTYEARIAELEGKLKVSESQRIAAIALTEATVSRYRTEQVESVAGRLVADNPQLKPVEKRLKECKDVKELRKLAESFSAITTKPLHEGTTRPDPRTSRRSLSESTPVRGPATGKPRNLMSALVESEG